MSLLLIKVHVVHHFMHSMYFVFKLPAVFTVPTAYTEAARGLCVTSANSVNENNISERSQPAVCAKS